MSGSLLRWSLELSEFEIIFKPHSAIKAQAIADFIAEFTNDSGGTRAKLHQLLKKCMFGKFI